jgi:hypothetical protein
MNGKAPTIPAARGLSLALIALCATAYPRLGRAAEEIGDPWAPGDGAAESAYRKTIGEGVAEYDAGHFEEARSLFRRAHETNPNARTFRGLGMTSFELRDYAAAVRNLSAALRDQRKPLSAEQRNAARELLERSRMFVDVYTLTLSPKDARVTIDGHAPEFEPDGTLLFGFGTHALEARAQGKATRSLSFKVRGGERRELIVTLEPVSFSGARLTDSGTPQLLADAKPSADVGSNRAASRWLWAGGATALLAGGAGFYFSRQNSELKSCRSPSAGLRCTDESAIQRQWYFALGATVVTGVAALTMGLVGVLSWKSSPPSAANHSAVDCTLSPFGITCGKTFQ